MTESAGTRGTSRREFLQTSSAAAAGVAIAGAIPAVHGGGDDTIRLALIGCGGRGGGAVGNALSVPGERVVLHAMADLFADKQDRCHDGLHKRYKDRIAVADERKFLGFDAYRAAIDTLRPGDIAVCATHAYCRPTQVEYAVSKGVHVFMEKSFGVDPPALRRMLRNGEAAERKGVRIAAGLMCRHSVARQALMQKLGDGELGEILLVRANRLSGGGPLGKRNPKWSELEWQIRHPGDFLWVSSGRFIEWLIHQVDECCWLMGAWPLTAHALGGRIPGSPDRGQNLHTYAVELTYPDGGKAMIDCRFMPKCHNEFATFVHGTRRAAQFSGQTHAGTVRTFKDRRIAKDNVEWAAPKEPCSPWQAEWNVFLDAIRNGRPHNETERAVFADFTALMCRAAAHTGRVVTWEEMFGSGFRLCEDVDGMTFDAPAPAQPDAEGRYPVPVPGIWREV